MAICWMTKTVVFGTSAFLCYVIISHYYRKKAEVSKTDDKFGFKIKVTDNVPTSNIHNERQVFLQNSVNPNDTPLTSKVEQVPHLAKENISNAPIRPSRANRKLFSTQQKPGKTNYRSTMRNNARFSPHNELNENVQNKSTLLGESGFGSAQSNIRTPFRQIDNSAKSTNNENRSKVLKLTRISDTSRKAKIFKVPTDNRSISPFIIGNNQTDETQDIAIEIPSSCYRYVVEHVIKFHENHLTNEHNNLYKKKAKVSDVIVTINIST